MNKNQFVLKYIVGKSHRYDRLLWDITIDIKDAVLSIEESAIKIYYKASGSVDIYDLRKKSLIKCKIRPEDGIPDAAVSFLIRELSRLLHYINIKKISISHINTKPPE